MKIKQVTVSRKLQAEFQSGELEERFEADEFLIRRERTFISAGPNWPSTRAGRHALFFLRRLLPGGAIWMQRFYAPAGRVPNNNFPSSIKLKRAQPIFS
jgi:hypothetical protein